MEKGTNRRVLCFFGIVVAAFVAAPLLPDSPKSAPPAVAQTTAPEPTRCVLSVATDKCSQHVVSVLWHNMQCGHSDISPAAVTFAEKYFVKYQIFNQATVYADIMQGVIDGLFARGEPDPLRLLCRQEANYVATLLQ